jgi:hypothetical protein
LVDNEFDSTKDEDGTIVLGFTGSVDFLFAIVLFVCDGDERFDDDNNLSLLDVVERMDEDLVTRDVIMGGAVLGSSDEFKDNDEGGDGESFPMLEHV